MMLGWVLALIGLAYAIYCIVIILYKPRIDDTWSLDPVRWIWDDGHMHAGFRKAIEVTAEALSSAIPRGDGFLWGTATAAHQIEGNCTNNNWSHWELKTRYDPMINDTVPTI